MFKRLTINLVNMKNIYQRLADVMAEIPAFQLDGNNAAQKYQFVSIKQIYNVLRPLLTRHGVISYPSNIVKAGMNVYTTMKWDSYNNREKESTMYYCEVTVEYTFSCEDGSKIIVQAEGGASDYSDKAQNQAMTNAHKNALKQLFMIAEGDPDSLSNGHDDYILLNTQQPTLEDMEAAFKAATTSEEVNATGKKYIQFKTNPRFMAAGSAARSRTQ